MFKKNKKKLNKYKISLLQNIKQLERILELNKLNRTTKSFIYVASSLQDMISKVIIILDIKTYLFVFYNKKIRTIIKAKKRLNKTVQFYKKSSMVISEKNKLVMFDNNYNKLELNYEYLKSLINTIKEIISY